MRNCCKSPVSCEFSEKAIMLSKAAIMNDAEAFEKIASAVTPAAAKQFGREIKGFDKEKWDEHVTTVARVVAFEKFSQSPEMRRVLLATGDTILAETTGKDKIWATGKAMSDPEALVPSAWPGTNILGWSLMIARDGLKFPNDWITFSEMATL